VFLQNDLVVGIWDGFPVNPGHALLIPRRHVANWFEATQRERIALIEALDEARRIISAKHSPAGFNVGINIGEAAGQTVFHLHVHLIPRYRGDVPAPQGGVRHVIPARGRYRSD
jgi:diadenosine tetraphosphate (Ap4A) HIT family hydrolase